MSTVVFPIGHYGGVRPVDAEAPVQVVRVGWKQHRLSEDAFGVWVLAHGLPDIGKGSWTVDDVIEQAEGAGVDDAKRHVDELVAAGLLATVADDPVAGQRFARDHRMDVMYVGLGNAPDRLDGHAVGIPGLGTAAVLDADCYELWQWGSVAPTIWHSCEVRASVTAQLGQPSDPAGVLTQILGDLRFLVAHGCAYLDTAG
ncbi:hypothetical protein E0H73_28590 [Kribbella pittospori]|uniref:Uncharacterized protein n=1 Tax=Kribbella pittospori TaxID=722689 RepID=A0A4R0KGR2_9ACTN|nr:hypothetical protein [Kribbella pittospori]TCC58274.1 hypothetical protein E0H73_28590 [Kribbella pittospori]